MKDLSKVNKTIRKIDFCRIFRDFVMGFFWSMFIFVVCYYMCEQDFLKCTSFAILSYEQFWNNVFALYEVYVVILVVHTLLNIVFFDQCRYIVNSISVEFTRNKDGKAVITGIVDSDGEKCLIDKALLSDVDLISSDEISSEDGDTK